MKHLSESLAGLELRVGDWIRWGKGLASPGRRDSIKLG